MRHFTPLLAVLLCATAPALAQVTVDLRALDALPRQPEASGHRAAPPSGSAPVAAQRKAPATASQPATATTQLPTAAAQSATVAPQPGPATTPPEATLPGTPPAVASVAPVAPPPPSADASPPAPPPIATDAATTAAATRAGLRLIFTKDQTDLSPDSAASIKHLVDAAPAGNGTTFNVLAYATGAPDDPSLARRTSLGRAVAVRAALMADGVPSSRIYLRALGAQPGQDAPSDRVELEVMGANATAARQQ